MKEAGLSKDLNDFKNYIDNICNLDLDNKLTNDHFSEMWCNSLVRLVGYHLGIVLEYSNYYCYDADTAVIFGLLQECTNKLLNIAELMSKGCLKLSVIEPLCRMYIENCINLIYLASNFNNKDELNKYRLNGLKYIKSYSDTIMNNCNNRGYVTDWENNLLISLTEEYTKLHTDEIKVKNCKNEKTIRDKFYSINKNQIYDVAYKTLCSPVHSTWGHLSTRILNYDKSKDTFTLKDDSRNKKADIRQLNPLLILTIHALKCVLDNIPNHGIEHKTYNNLDIIKQAVINVEKMHFNFLNKKPVMLGIEQF